MCVLATTYSEMERVSKRSFCHGYVPFLFGTSPHIFQTLYHLPADVRVCIQLYPVTILGHHGMRFSAPNLHTLSGLVVRHDCLEVPLAIPRSTEWIGSQCMWAVARQWPAGGIGIVTESMTTS